jgi:hypothetical protein
MPNTKVPKNATKFICDICYFKCCKESNYNSHLLTRKHKILTNPNEIVPKNADKNHTCECGKQYKHMSSLCNHKKTCSLLTNEPTKNDDSSSDKKLIMELLKSNNELQKQIIELCKDKSIITNNSNNTTNKTNNFNLQLFLNEQCKDAMNFSDFINGIEVSHEDLENNAQLGFVGGVSKILIDNLKLLNKNERPIHCTDVKRETMYIKDDNKWTKEDNDSKLRSAIQEITRKSISTLMAWKRGNPESDDMDSEFSGRCIVIQQQSMAGYNREVYYPKVIHAIAREVFVSK